MKPYIFDDTTAIEHRRVKDGVITNEMINSVIANTRRHGRTRIQSRIGPAPAASKAG